MNSASRPTVSVATLGCKVNQAESDAYAQRFGDAGFTIVQPDAAADVCVVNSCTVTNVGDQKSRQLIQRLRRDNPDSLLAVTGCYASVAPEAVARLTGADLVIGQQARTELVAMVTERLIERGFSRPLPRDPLELLRATPRTRINIKVQDGCNDFCAFCIVPRARGRARSVPLTTVVKDVRRAVAEGYQEVVLTGVNMTTYGRDTDTTFGRLLDAVLEQTDVARIRLSSIEPFTFDTAWLPSWASGRLCRHLHLPLQSGCDDTLGRMRRRYSSADYAQLLADIRTAVPGMALWTDVIAGFPGETDEEFERSLSFIEEQRFAGLHVFRYSPRSGTAAARMPDQVSEALKKERSQRLLSLARRGSAAFAASLVGSTTRVLFEEEGAGLSDTYVRVQVATGGQPNTFATVRLTHPHDTGLAGQTVDG